MSDELQPFFESRETRLNRLPPAARGRFLSASTSARESGDTDFEDRQFVSLWLAQRTGLPRKQVVDNFKGIAERFFGPGTTAAGAYDSIAATYKPAGGDGAEDPNQGGNATPGAQAAPKDEEYADVAGFPKPGVQSLLENAGQIMRSIKGGFEGVAQKVPAGLYSQAAAVTGAPSMENPMADPEYAALFKRNQQIEDPYQFTQVFDNEPGNYRAPLTADEEAEMADNSAKMTAILRRLDGKNRTAVKEWAGSKMGNVSQEYRRLAGFWYDLSGDALDRNQVNPDFQKSTLGQFSASAGSVPATVALAALGVPGAVGLESMFYADVEQDRMGVEGSAYNPDKAVAANLASAVPQMVLERAFGVERLLNKVLGEVPKHGGKIVFGDFAKQFVRQGLAAGAEEGITEPAQGFWNDYMASLTYDQQRETLTGEGAKRRMIESVSAFTLGALFGGGVTALEVADHNRAVGTGAEYLTTKSGQVLTPADFNVLRQVKTDEQIAATAPDPETGKVLLAAANGDKAAQADYNNRVLASQFVKTEGMEIGGLSLGLVQDAPVVKMADGVIVPLDMTNAEDVAFMDAFKKQAVLAQAAVETAKVRQQALEDTANFLAGKVEPGREVKVSTEERTLRDFIQEGRLSAEDAAGRIGIANDVNAANLPAGTNPEDVRVLGANVGEYIQGVYRDVSTVYAGGNALTAIEEVAEGYIKKRLAVGDVHEQEIANWRAKYEAATGAKTETGGTVSNIEWFSKRAVDYAVSNRKADGMPASLSGFFRTLGEHLKTVFRLAQKMAKLKRDGLLEDGFEEALRAATGLGDQNTVSAARRARQAELEQAFAPVSGNEFFANSAANYERLKAQLQQEATAADEKATRERDFTRARLEEQLQAIADNQLGGDESITLDTITPEQKWTLKAARRAREDGMKVRLSAQADRLLTEEGGYEDIQQETRANDTQTWRQRMESAEEKPITPSEVAEAKQRAEAAANVDPEIFGPEPTVGTVDDDILEGAQMEADFPRVARVGDEYVATAPTGQEIGRASTQEAAMNKALKWYESIYRGEEMAAIEKMHKLDSAIGRILTDVRKIGGLPAISAEKIFKGELRVIADGLPTHLRLKLFRKKGLQLDSLRESLNELGYNYDTVSDLLDDLDSAVRLLAEKNARGYMVTFSLAAGRVSPDQIDMFSGGETGGDTMFNLQGQEAKDFTGVVDQQAASMEAKEKAAADQGEMTFSLEAIREKWTNQGLKMDVFEKAGVITLSRVQVAKELQGQGIGTQVMQELTAYADQTNQSIALTPSADFGATSVSRLRDFYKRFGFVDNKGRSKDFSTKETMIRPAVQGTNSPAFKAWFKDSKVVDAVGKPMPVYHGTGANFRKFNLKKQIQGIIWFTTDKSRIESGVVGANGKGKIMEMYASIQNPAGWDVYDKRGLYEFKSLGYDGALLSNGDGTFDGFVFKSEQLKSTTKNKGAFDATNPDITFATTGIPQNQVQALQAQAQRIRSKKLMATGELLARIQAGQTIPQRVKAVRRSTQASLLARLAVPVVSRLNALSPQLGTRLRRFEFDLGQRLTADYARVTPFAQAVEGMKDGDAALLDLALKNGDTASRDAVLNTYGIQAQFAEVLKVIEETRLRAIAAGYEVNQIKDYFPRKVADLDGLMVHFHGRPEAGQIEKAIKAASDAALAQGRILTAEERMEVTNSALQGNRKGSAMPGNLKTRSVDVVDVDANAYYTDSVTALSYYLESMNSAIEKRRFFGKYSVPVAAVPGTNTSRLNLEASIGGIVEDLIAQDALDRQGQQEVQAILEARFNQQSSSEFIKNFKGLAYMSTMGQVTSSLTQLTDLAFSLYENGVYDTVVSGAQAVTRDSKITRASLGLETVAEEFRDTGAMHKAVDRVFKLVGIHYLDLIGKETLTNAKLRKMQREARAGQLSQRSTDLINRVFGAQAGAQVIQDLAAGKVTPDVQFAIYNVLADYQPVSLSEYPEFYLRHPNGRVFYMLKTFTLKQIDAFRREALTQIVKGNAKQKAAGFRNLVHLAGLLYIIGVPVDWLKDWIMARDPQLSDIAVDNVFKLLGVNRWNLWNFRESKDPVQAALLLVAPPAPFLVYPLTDIAESAEKISEGDDIKPGEFESWRMLPFVGAPIYWYLGGGEEKIKKRAEKRAKKAGAGETRIKR